MRLPLLVLWWHLGPLATVADSADRGLQCADIVCAGNATCLIHIGQAEPMCIKRTKQGTCASDEKLLGCPDLELLCVSDSDCAGDEICCRQGCQRRCQQPVSNALPKPGHCPARFTFGPCVHECSEDGDCPSSTKCCSTGCGLVCSAPAVSRAGACPVPEQVGGNCSTSCSSDSQCAGQLKCCSNGCGAACVASSHQSLCPAGTVFHNRCNRCTCSGHHEPVQCETSVCAAEKPGFCPGLARQSEIVLAGCGRACREDAECPGEAKCCQIDGCGLTCSPKAFSRPGVCPVAEGNDPCGEFCHEDSDCSGDAKCCLTGCGKLCKPAEAAGFCPAQLAGGGGGGGGCLFRHDQCTASHQCRPGQICCDSPCGKMCSWPAVEKPGLCPFDEQLDFGDGGIFCSSDEQCGRDLKCCRDSRGNQDCTQPTIYRRTCRNVKCKEKGFYCIDTDQGPECVDRPKSMCADTVCDDNTSCVQKPDRAICVAHTKVGHCPLIATRLRPCQSVEMSCERDDDCPGRAICCTAGCSRGCVEPQKTDCTSVGHSLCNTAGYVCRDREHGAVCVEDVFTCEHKKCPDGYQCIESLAGSRCEKARQSCDTKICAPGEICYMEEDGAICRENIIAGASINTEVFARPGRCPPILPGQYRGDCKHMCSHDAHCPGARLCCDRGCARACVPPVLRVTCSELSCAPGHACFDSDIAEHDAICLNTERKPGRCPGGLSAPVSLVSANLSTAGSCDDQLCPSCAGECVFDLQCAGAARCCSDGCGGRCVEPDLRVRCDDVQCEDGYFCHDPVTRDAECRPIDARPGRCAEYIPIARNSTSRTVYAGSGCSLPSCLYDESCGPGDKCCPTGECGDVCYPADLRILCEDRECDPGSACVEYVDKDAECFSTEEKSGLCPRVQNVTMRRGGCTATCQYDSQCAGDAKCCHNGCATVCLAPREPDCETIKCRVGTRCTETRLGKPFCQPIPCKQDGEIIDIECNSCTCIQGFLLCSQEECPPVKAGFCPRLTKGYRGRCVEECDSDYQCDGDRKCCSTGCGHTCQDSVPEVVHPCKTVRFRCGESTKCAATRGLCQPGKTCPLSPLCVSNRVPFCDQCPLGKVCVLQKRSCPSGGTCHRQPICIQLYKDDVIFEEDENLETEVVIKQNS